LAGDSSSFTAGTRVDVDGLVTAGCDDGGAGVAAGAGSVVATVVGAEHAAKVNDANRRIEVDAVEVNDFITELTGKGML
jgi:ABC-type xylose transport system permease subunit